MEKYIAELLGTMVLVVINNGVVANVLLKKTKGSTEENWFLITLAAGLAVTFGIYVAMTTSGAHINPAVSITFFALGKLAFVDLIFYVLAQFLGGFIGGFFVYLAYKQHYAVTKDKEKILATFSTSPAIKNRFWNITTEVIATFFLVGLVVTVTHSSNQVPIYLIPVLIGLLVMVLGVSLGGSTGFAMNPARDIGPRLTHTVLRLGPSNWHYALTPLIGPIIGGLLGGFFFTYIF